jgi:hypothetical protein
LDSLELSKIFNKFLELSKSAICVTTGFLYPEVPFLKTEQTIFGQIGKIRSYQKMFSTVLEIGKRAELSHPYSTGFPKIL